MEQTNKFKDIIEWLQKPCPEEDIKYLDDAKNIAYLPIGIVENYLDEIGEWSTQNFKFNIYKNSNFLLASGSLELVINLNENTKRTMVGACTFPINRNDENMDYEATIVSFCISNAAKKLGKRFGRHLNGRLKKGETGVTINHIINNEPESISEEFELVVKKLSEFNFKEDAEAYLNTTSFQYYIPAKNLINLKPQKSKNGNH